MILSRPTAVRVLRALSRHGGALSVTRVASDSRTTPNAARETLGDLVDCSVVERLGSGKSRLYRAIDTHPLNKRLQDLFLAEGNLLADALAGIAEIARATSPKVIAVWLFGSVARGEDTLASDLDVAIVIDAADSEVTRVADGIRQAVLEIGARTGFAISIVSMSLGDIRRMKSEGAPLWVNLTRDYRHILGQTTLQVLSLVAERFEGQGGDEDRGVEASQPGLRPRSSQ